VARRTREHRGPGRGHDGTVDTPAAESEPLEDRDLHLAKFPTPAAETFTRAESTPPPPTPSHSATTSPAPTPSVPDDTTNPHPPQPIAAARSRDTWPPNATNTAHAPSPKPHNKPEPPTHTCPPMWERPSRASQNMNFKVLATSRLFFSRHPKNSRLHLHPSKTSRILLPFRVSYTLPRRLIFFTFSCSFPLYNSHQFLVPPYFGVWYSLLLESHCQLLYLCTSR